MRVLLLALLLVAACGPAPQCGAIGDGSVGAPSGGSAVLGTCVPGGTLCPATGICRIAVLGDSTSAWPDGEGTPTDGDNWVTEISNHFGRCHQFDNHAVAASTVSDNQSTWDATVEGGGYHVLITLMGVNDINGGANGVTTANAIKAIHAEAELDTTGRAGGVKVLSLEVTPWKLRAGWTEAKQTQLDALNSALATPDNGNVTADVGLYAEYEDDSNPDECPAALCYDGLHYTNSGTSNPGDGTITLRDYILAAGYFSD